MRQLQKILTYIVIASLCFCFSLVAIASLFLIVQTHWNGPWTDMWEVMSFMQPGYEGVFSWSSLWEHYGNSHRFTVAKFLWLTDWWLVKGNNHFLLTLSIICQLLIALVFMLAVKGLTLTKRWLSLYIALLVFYLFNPSQLFNFFHTFDVQWFIVAMAAVLSTYLLALNTAPSTARLIVVFWLCLIASLCNFSGMLIFCSSIVLMWWWRYPARYTLAFAVAAVIYYALYSVDLQLQSTNLVAVALGNTEFALAKRLFLIVGILLVYPLTMLSSPLAYVLRPGGDWQIEQTWLNWLPQLVVLIGLVFLIYRCIKSRNSCDVATRLAVGLIFYTLLTVFAIAMGRGFFFETAYADRFQNIVLLFWLALALLLVSRWQVKGLLVAASLALLTHGLTIFHQLDRAMVLVNRAELSHAALRLGIVDKMNALQGTVSKFQLIYNPAYTLENERTFLSAHGLGIFAEPTWSPPTPYEQAGATDCELAVALHADGIQQKSALSLLQLTSVGAAQPALFVYIDGEWVALLTPKRSDQFIEWVKASNVNVSYEGFMRGQFYPPLTLTVFTKENATWCRTSVVVD